MRVDTIVKVLERVFKLKQYSEDRGSTKSNTSDLSPSYLEKFKLAEKALKKVEIPGYGVDIVSSGLVKKMSLVEDGTRLVVYLDYTGSSPACYFRKFLNDHLWLRILREAKEELMKAGFDKVTFIDFRSDSLLEE